MKRIFSIILTIAMTGLPVIFPDSPVWSAWILWSCIFLISVSIITLIMVQIKTGQGGCKVKIDIGEDSSEDRSENSSGDQGSSAAEAGIHGRGADKYWILGMFYHNPGDPAYIIENRFGTSFGFNYAHLPVKAGAAVLLFGLAAMYVWITILLL